MVAVLTGCAVTVPGKPLGEDTSGPPVLAGGLEALLLDAAEINAAMGATEMTVTRSADHMWDSHSYVSGAACLAVYGVADDKVYAGSGWSAVRYASLKEPVDDPPHVADQAVVSFPSRDVAAEFSVDSAEDWARCGNSRFSVKLSERVEALWTVGEVSDIGGMLTMSMTMEDNDGWGCRRALTVRNNVAVDVTECSYDSVDNAAVNISRDIADKVPNG